MTAEQPSQSEGLMAARNALTLGTSLALTAGMALLVRLFIPRFLGPGAFGELRLAESLAEMLFVVLTFGVDMQLRREAAVDPTQARRYLAGLTTLRLALGGAAIVATVVVLKVSGSSDRLALLFVVTALAQIFLVLNNSYAALEQASGDVAWLARTNFVSKVAWLVATLAVLTQVASGLAVALAALAVESLRFAWFTTRGIRRHQLIVKPELRPAISAVLVSMPFFINAIAHNLYARVGTGWLAATCTDVEVGLYGAAASLAAIALLGMPLLSWVLVPATSRAGASSAQDRDALMAGALRVSLLLGIPLAAMIHASASLSLLVLFGSEFRAATPVLRVMAPTVGLAYISTVCAIALIQRGQTWTVAAISIAGVAVTVALDAVLIPWGVRSLGVAGGAQGAAWATLGTELIVTAALGLLSRSSWMEPLLLRTAAAMGTALVVMAMTARYTRWQDAGPGVAALAAFAVAVVAFGGVDRTDLAFSRQVLVRSPHPAPAGLVPEVS